MDLLHSLLWTLRRPEPRTTTRTRSSRGSGRSTGGLSMPATCLTALSSNPVILTTVEHHRCTLGDWIGASAMRRSLVRATMLLPVSIFCWFAPVAHAGLDRYQDLIVADGNPRSELPKQGIRVTYLGTNAYLLESRSATLLVDPYFSRVGLLRVALNLRALPKRDLIEQICRPPDRRGHSHPRSHRSFA